MLAHRLNSEFVHQFGRKQQISHTCKTAVCLQEVKGTHGELQVTARMKQKTHPTEKHITYSFRTTLRLFFKPSSPNQISIEISRVLLFLLWHTVLILGTFIFTTGVTETLYSQCLATISHHLKTCYKSQIIPSLSLPFKMASIFLHERC